MKSNMRFNSIRFKASILYSVILALILFIFSTVIYMTISNILYDDIDEELKIKAEEISGILYAYQQVKRSTESPLAGMIEVLKSEGSGFNQKMIIDDLWRSQLEVLNLKDDYINILNVNGNTLFRSNNLKEDVAILFSRDLSFSLNGTNYKTIFNDQEHLRAISLPIKFLNTQLIIQVGTSEESIIRILDRLLMFMALAAGALLAVTSFLGSYFVRKSLQPVKEVVGLANRITGKDLSERIEEKNIDEEMKELVNAFNVMIKRLETSFGHINEFSSHAAHELKTPLAILRGEIELALDEDKSSTEYKKILTESLSEIDRMIKVVKDLLLLAKIEYRPEIFHFEKVNLIPFLNEIYEQSKILAEPKELLVKFNLPGQDIIINADKVHLRRLFHNIIGNAVKYTPPQRSITLTASAKGAQCIIEISDTGNGISEENLKKVFEKFFRVYKEEEFLEAGTGLGLSIALSIAKAHNGDISVRSQINQGTTFKIALPLGQE